MTAVANCGHHFSHVVKREEDEHLKIDEVCMLIRYGATGSPLYTGRKGCRFLVHIFLFPGWGSSPSLPSKLI